MISAPETPLVITSANDEVGVPDALVPPPDSTTNFADNKEARAWLDANVLPLLSYVRADGEAQRAEWGKIRRMGLLERDDIQAYLGQSDAYLPVYQKARETRVSHLSRGLFPSDSYIDCDSENPALEQNKNATKAWMMYQLEKAARLRSELKPFLRSLTDYGLGVGKIWWEKPINPVRATKMARIPGISDMLMNYGDSSASWGCVGARFKARSVFSWYVWPISVNSLDEASIVFEDIQVSKTFIEMMGKRGVWKNVEEIANATNSEELSTEIQEQLAEIARSTSHAVSQTQGDLAHWSILTECWLRMPVPAALYRPNETKGEPVPVKVVYSGGVLVEARRNPFWHQKPPYVFKRMHETTDSFYGTGMGRSMLSVQGLINDFINQTNDNGMYGLNPIIKYNPNLIVGPLEPLAPGRMLALTDPAGMVFDRPPVEQLQYGLMLTNQLITYANDLTGVPAVLQGTGAKGGAKTATGSQILQSNVKGELQDLIEEIEQCVLEPAMQMIHSLGQQYESAERWLAISGGEKIQFSRDMLEGEFGWKWVASSQAVNQQQRAQATMQFLQIAANPAVLQLLLQQQKIINPEPILRKLWEDGLGLRNFDQILATPMMPPMMPGAPGGAAPGAKAPPGGEPRSAVEQAPGGSGPMAPGEGEDFMNVRGGADEMAAMMGAQGGFDEE